MEEIINYVKPEFIVVIIALYFVKKGLEKSKIVKKKYIPLLMGCTGILLCGIEIIGMTELTSLQEISTAVFTASVQGILVAGVSSSIDQFVKN